VRRPESGGARGATILDPDRRSDEICVVAKDDDDDEKN
jgi:hypothetical protein